MKEESLMDAYLYNAGFGAIARYLEDHPAETINPEVRRWILNDVIGNSSEHSTQAQEIKQLLKLESKSTQFNLSLAPAPSIWSVLARFLARFFF